MCVWGGGGGGGGVVPALSMHDLYQLFLMEVTHIC